MEEEKKIDPKFRADAKFMVDALFDAKIFHERLTRDHFQSIEDIIASNMQSGYDSYIRTKELMAKIAKYTK